MRSATFLPASLIAAALALSFAAPARANILVTIDKNTQRMSVSRPLLKKAVLMSASPEIMNRSFRIGLLPIALALAGSLRADDQAAPAQHPDDVASLRADNKQLSDELAASWKEADRLKADLAAAQAASAKGADEAADLRKQLDAAAAQPPKTEAAPAPADSDAAKQVADLQDKLALALRSFSVLQDENTQLKAAAEILTIAEIGPRIVDAVLGSISSGKTLYARRG